MQALGGVAAMGSAFQMAQDVAGTPAAPAGNATPPRRVPRRGEGGDGTSLQ
jgi:hypothetical protein